MRLYFLLITLVLVFITFSTPARATLGVDVAGYIPLAAAKCMHSAGYRFAIVRCYQSLCKPDPNCPATVKNFLAAGFAHVDIYYFANVHCGNAAGCFNSMMSSMSSTTGWGMVWFDVEIQQDYWSTSTSTNVQYLQALMNAANAHGTHWGVYSQGWQWDAITGSCSTPGSSGHSMWYAHYDGEQNYDDWKSFAGWAHPAIKQFAGDATVCSEDVDENWYPNGLDWFTVNTTAPRVA